MYYEGVNRWILGKITVFGVESEEYLKSTEFGGKLQKSEALRTLLLNNHWTLNTFNSQNLETEKPEKIYSSTEKFPDMQDVN